MAESLATFTSACVRRRPLRAVAAGALTLGLAAALAGCGGTVNNDGGGGGGGGASASSGTGSVLTVNNGSSGNFTDDFNPFSLTPNTGTQGMVYEPLVFFNITKANSTKPLLATSYAWADGGRKITFDLRRGVKWSDGTPFTSADVAFTFDLQKDHAALNTYAVPFKTITAPNAHQVSVTFTRPAYSDLWYLAGRTYIVPKHLWSKIPAAKLQTYANSKPVGTGGWTLKSSTPQNIFYKPNPGYWGGKPQLAGIHVEEFSSNESADAALEAGQIDWSSNFIPNIDKTYVAKNSDFHYANQPIYMTNLMVNLHSGPTAQLAVRKALLYAIDRNRINQSVYYGHAFMPNLGQVILPGFKSDLDPSVAAMKLTFDPAKAKALLTAAGYKLGSDGIFTGPDGKPLSLTCQVIAGYSDYISALQLMTSEFKQAGIRLNVDQESYSQFTSNQDEGKFQVMITNFGASPSPQETLDTMLDPDLIKPIGQQASGNYPRFRNATVQRALTAISNTQSQAAQVRDYDAIERVLAAQLPYIPIVQAQGLNEYNTAHATGFPTLQNSYADSAPYESPDIGIVADRLKAK